LKRQANQLVESMKLFIKNVSFTLVVPGTVAIYIPLIIAHSRNTSASPFLFVMGIALLALGIVIYLWTVWDFAISGRGTPLPMDAPKTLVVRGLYCYTRNPMYLGVITVILGWSVLFSDGWLLLYALGIWVLTHLFVVLYEEPRLTKLFGSEYEKYRQTVSRWVPIRQ
jgi:protein-S-isoprenylcysteine O-methyltransferase Ste14